MTVRKRLRHKAHGNDFHTFLTLPSFRHISLHAGRFFCSVLVEVPDAEPAKPETEGLGVDLRIKSFAVVSDGREFPSVNKARKVKNRERSSNGNSGGFRENAKARRKILGKEKIQANDITSNV